MTLARPLIVVVCALLTSQLHAGERRPFYFGASYGGTVYDVDYEFATDLPFDPEDEGDTWGAQVGYLVTDNWIVQLDYTHSNPDDVEIDQVFLSVNYEFPFLLPKMRARVGIVAGEGSLEWKDQPGFADSFTDNLDVDQSLYGAQVGLVYDLDRRFSTSLTYQYFDQTFKSDLETDFGLLEFEHDAHQYLLIALRYHF